MINADKAAKEKANAGCNICPCCGESSRMYVEFANKPHVRGIAHNSCDYYRGFFKQRHYVIDKYHCYSCGAEFESDVYEVQD